MENFFGSFIFDLSSSYSKKIFFDKSFVDFAKKFTSDYGTVFLLSNKNFDCGEYNILGYKPWFHLYSKNKKIIVNIYGNSIEIKENSLDVLKEILKIYNINNFDIKLPIVSGIMGYLSYDLKNSYEKIPLTGIDVNNLPDICFFGPSILVVQDLIKKENKVFTIINCLEQYVKLKKIINNFNKKLHFSLNLNGNNYSYDDKGCKSNLTHIEYIKAVKRIKKYIEKGHVYQVNFSHRFEVGFKGDGFSFFKDMYHINPASFFAYINAYDHQIISTSPERLIKRYKRKIESRPIKGTRPRGKTKEFDRFMKKDLLHSTKDDAELSMIVDLLRNDFGKICLENSIRIRKHKKLEIFHNVYHLVSTITGILQESKNSVDIIKAIFPGGSITGCPKVRSMEIIDEIEVAKRHIYTGSIGYISFHDTMDLSIAIRTAVIFKEKVYFSVGGGIVYDSNPEDEFQETLHKGETILNSFTDNLFSKKCSIYMPVVWLNGVLINLDTAKVPISDLGLMYGFGFFETILVKKGKILLLSEHIERFNITWNNLFCIKPPDLTWNIIIKQLIESNNAQYDNIAIKIIATRGEKASNSNFDGSIFVMAKLYEERKLYIESNYGLNVSIYPEFRHTPLANYKTLNYLFYYFAKIWAKKNSFDEVLILNYDGSISEGNSSNIILINKNKVIIPKSKFVLQGVMVTAVLKELKNMGYQLLHRSVKPSELLNMDFIFMTNSLMGIIPINSINNKLTKLNYIAAGDIINIINKKIFIS